MQVPALLVFACAAASALAAQSTGLAFDHGVDEHVDVPYDPLVVPQTGLTVEAWIRYNEAAVPAGAGFRWPTVVRQDPAPGMESFFLRVGASSTANRSLEFAVRTTAGLRLATYQFAPGELGVWTHVAGTYDGATLRLYKGGVQVGSASGTGLPPLDTGGVLRIGNGDTSAAGAETWSGEIDEVRVWPFARSAAELVQTRDDMLAGLPGGVVTFNLENHYLDTSSGLSGAAVGTPTFVPAMPLAPWSSSASAFGSSTTACAPLSGAIGSKPVVPFPDFTVRCVGAPASAAGFFAVGLGAYASPVTVLGVDVYVDLASVIVVAPIASDALGLATVAIGIDPDPGLVGVNAYVQHLFVDAACGPAGFTASDALAVTIQ